MTSSAQIKSKKRVSEHGEVFTNDREVNAMLDLVNDEIERIDSTVLEPACGEGAFILQIFERKMRTIRAYKWNGWTKEFMTLRAVSSIYGVDIQDDNVQICRNKLYAKVLKEFRNPSTAFCKMLREIIKRNIVAGNTLTALTNSNTTLTFSEWFFESDGVIKRRQYTYAELLEHGGECNTGRRFTKYDAMKKERAAEYGTGVVFA